MLRDRSTTMPSVSDCPLVPVPPPRAATAQPRDLATQASERTQAVPGLQPCQDDEAEREQQEASDQGPPERVDLRIEPIAALRHLEPPAHR